MMKYITLCIALLCGASRADPLPERSITNMVAQMESVMAAGLCIVANDTADYKAETVLLVLPAPLGARRVLRNDYNWIRSAGYEKLPSGRYLMGDRIREACAADAVGGRCLAARALWRQTP